MYVEIKENKLLSWCENPYMDYKFVDIDYSTFNPEKYKVINNNLVSRENDKDYLDSQRKKEIQQELINADITYNKFIDTPVKYLNNFYYKPKYVNDYVLMVASGLSYEIWDTSELHSEIMNTQQIKELALFLKQKTEPEFQNRKEKRRILLEELATLG